jgi:anaerobic selenocysteine-containing dehydrogenase
LNDRLNQLWSMHGREKLDLNTRYNTAEILDRVLKAGFAVEQGLGYFKDSGIYNKPFKKAEAYNYYYFPMGTTRHPFYFEQLMKDGLELRRHLNENDLSIPFQDMTDIWRFYQPIPQWVGRPDEQSAAEFPLYAMNWSTPQFRMHNSDQTGNPILNDMANETDPYLFVILINPQTACRLSICEGDEVVIEAYWGGKTQGTLKLTNLIHPDAVGIPGISGLKTIRGNPLRNRRPNFNLLLNAAEGSFDPLHGGIDRNPRVKVYRAGVTKR